MNLQNYIDSLPKSQRGVFREMLAEAHGRPVATIYKWIKKGTHPASDEAMRITEVVTKHMVSRFDERPDVWALDGVINALGQIGFEVNEIVKGNSSEH